jgi:phosphoribosylamine--glycine ligase
VKFVVATADFAGLGFALRILEEGHDVLVATNPDPATIADPEARAAFERVGNGMVEKERLESAMARRAALRDACWIWDANHSVAENEALRAEGFRVLGGGRYADAMEHDRAACLDFVSRLGLACPSSFPFSDSHSALEFLRENRDVAYVLKPDHAPNHETFLPESEDPSEANEELRAHLTAREIPGGFILQERKEGVETNVEVWFVAGEPRFALMALECKRKSALDLGPLVGCALDFAFTIPLECRAVADSVGRLFPAYREMRYTGLGDANVIAGKDGIWFLEKCERLGYNAHPNLLFNLSRRPVSTVFASLVDGTFEPDFSEGFGASLTMWTKAGVPGGEAVLFPARQARNIYFYDVERRGEQILTAGFDSEGAILIATGHGYTLPTAWEAVAKTASEIRFPYRHYRPDGDATNYPSSPIRRYEALKAMGYV